MAQRANQAIGDSEVRGGKSDVLVTAIRDLNLRKGATKPHAFECDDGRTYLVKFCDRTRTVINEHVGYSLAGFLELPVPEGRHVMVPQELIDASDDLRMRKIAAGVHHGSLWLGDSVDFSRITARNLPVANADCLPGLIVLDNLILNWDSNNPFNNLLQSTASGDLEFKTVDFNEILAGPRWTIETMNLVKTTSYLMSVFPIIGLSVKGLPSFSPWLEKTEAISTETVGHMLSEVPSSWDVDEGEKAAISDFILTRKAMVRGILVANKARFLNWR
jgi:hypothetical protein